MIAHALLERLGPDVIGRPVRLSPEAAYLLRECAWPGNVRELENTLRAACVLCDDDVITERELATLVRVRGSEEAPARGGATPRPKGGHFSRARKRGRRSKHTREGVLAALEEADGDYDVAAAALEVSLRTLYRYVDKYEL